MSVADEVRAALEEIAAQNAGRLLPESVVQAAVNPLHPLHNEFEWDDSTAAHQHRLNQARTLIRSVKVTVTTEKRVVSTVFYVRDPSAGAGEQGYVSVAKLRTEADMAREALVAEFQRAASLLQRARDLALVLEMEGEVDEAIDTIDTLRQRVSQQPQQVM